MRKMKTYSVENYIEEYRMLREEAQDCFKKQQEWSRFSITTVVTILGFAINKEEFDVDFYLLPYVILVIAAEKVHFLRRNILRIAGYLKFNMENQNGFMWETNINQYRKMVEQKTNTAQKIILIMETQEFTILGFCCMLLYVYKILADLDFFLYTSINSVNIWVGLGVHAIMITFLCVVSMDYYTFKSSEIENNDNEWKHA